MRPKRQSPGGHPGLEEGSVISALRIPENAKPVVARLFKGPQKDWTASDYNAAEPLQSYMRRRDATIAYRLGKAKERQLRVINPQEAPPSTRATSRFFVFIAGLGGVGDVPNVALKIGGTRKVRARILDPALVKRLGSMFWENAFVTLEAHREESADVDVGIELPGAFLDGLDELDQVAPSQLLEARAFPVEAQMEDLVTHARILSQSSSRDEGVFDHETRRTRAAVLVGTASERFEAELPPARASSGRPSRAPRRHPAVYCHFIHIGAHRSHASLGGVPGRFAAGVQRLSGIATTMSHRVAPRPDGSIERILRGVARLRRGSQKARTHGVDVLLAAWGQVVNVDRLVVRDITGHSEQMTALYHASRAETRARALRSVEAEIVGPDCGTPDPAETKNA